MSPPDPQPEKKSNQNTDDDSNTDAENNNSSKQPENNQEEWDGVERRGSDRPWSDVDKEKPHQNKENSQEQVLTNEEREALSGDVQELSDESGVMSYDFYSPAHINKSNLPALSIINEKIVDSMKEKLSEMLQRELDVVASDIEIIRYGEFINALPSLVDIIVVNISKIDAQALLCVDGTLIELVMDAYFGGEGKISEAQDKSAFTQTELNLSNKLLDIFITSNKYAWEKSEQLEISVVQREPQPKLINLIEEADLIVSCKFQVKLGDEKSSIRIAYPYKSLEPIRDSLRTIVSENSDESSTQWKNELIKSLKSVPIEVKTVLTEFPLSVEQIVKLKEGDVLQFSMPDAVTVYSNAIPILKGKIGNVSGNVAVSVDKWISKVEK